MANILIVDDSMVMRRNLRAILTKAGHNILAEASNGNQGYLEYKKNMPDLVTMDITMPGMDGIAAVKKIIDEFPDAKIVMISALDQRSMVFEALENGAKHYIIKPITIEKVVNVVNEVLKQPKQEIAKKVEHQKNEERDISNDKIQPFSIDNLKGKFLVTVNNSIDINSFNSLNMALEGLLFIKPLSITFEFNIDNDLDSTIKNNFNQIFDKIRNAGGVLTIDGFR